MHVFTELYCNWNRMNLILFMQFNYMVCKCIILFVYILLYIFVSLNRYIEN